MPRVLGFAGIILAVANSPIPGQKEALSPWHGGALLQAHIQTLQLHTDFVLVVAGQNAAALEPVIDANAAFLKVVPGGQAEFAALQAGLQEVLNRGRDAAIVTPVGRPPVRTATVQFLRRALESAPHEIWVVAPEHGGRHGYPVVVGREMMTVYLAARPDRQAQEIEHAHQSHIRFVAVDDPLTVADFESQESCSQTAP